jgi:choline kinase
MYKEAPLFSVSNQKFNVIILAAGLGTRLKPETDFIPKALIELGGLRSIDYSIRKYQYISGRMIVATGYSADLVMNYVMGKYSSLNLFFSREEVSELKGPGTSLMYALDYASSKLPTIITFCDYIVCDQFSVEYDCIGICKPGKEFSILGDYKTIAVIEEGVAVDLQLNKNNKIKDNGFTGIAIFHNTKLLKAIAYNAAASKSNNEDIDFAFEIIAPYLSKVKTIACPISSILEFGTTKTLVEIRRYINGNN